MMSILSVNQEGILLFSNIFHKLMLEKSIELMSSNYFTIIVLPDMTVVEVLQIVTRKMKQGFLILRKLQSLLSPRPWLLPKMTKIVRG